MTSGSGGDMPRVVSTFVVALYRPADGRVLHLHTVRVFEGGRAIGREEAEKTALANAARHGHDVASLKIHHAAELPGDFGIYRVDAVTGRLVGQEIPSPVRRDLSRR
jgi:hypothetical protein